MTTAAASETGLLQLRATARPLWAWSESAGRGYLEVRGEAKKTYNDAYRAKYEQYAETDLGRELTAFRVSFVARHAPIGAPLLDFGCCAMQFLRAWGGEARGYDVIESVRADLKSAGRFIDPARDHVPPVVTCWDSLEHLREPESLVAKIPLSGWLFASLPVFAREQHALDSRHFRPDEHYHYFTEWGLVRWMNMQGFTLADVSWAESELGRDNIMACAFRRVDAADRDAARAR